jgi:hypothetical protein
MKENVTLLSYHIHIRQSMIIIIATDKPQKVEEIDALCDNWERMTICFCVQTPYDSTIKWNATMQQYTVDSNASVYVRALLSSCLYDLACDVFCEVAAHRKTISSGNKLCTF